jgi:hypothetical protein
MGIPNWTQLVCGCPLGCVTMKGRAGGRSADFPPKMATLTGAIGTGSKWLLDKIVGAIAATGINPNVLTFLGLVVNFGAAASFAVGKFFLGALIIFFAGFLDMLDGQVARRQNRVTAFGAFYDSTLDRYADMALYMGLLVYYSVSVSTITVIHRIVFTWQETRAGRTLPGIKLSL